MGLYCMSRRKLFFHMSEQNYYYYYNNHHLLLSGYASLDLNNRCSIYFSLAKRNELVAVCVSLSLSLSSQHPLYSDFSSIHIIEIGFQNSFDQFLIKTGKRLPKAKVFFFIFYFNFRISDEVNMHVDDTKRKKKRQNLCKVTLFLSR